MPRTPLIHDGTVLVIGATGMAGHLAVQSAFALGAERVIAAGRDEAALARFAEQQSFLYGLLAIGISLLMGWAAGRLFALD